MSVKTVWVEAMRDALEEARAALSTSDSAPGKR